MATTYGLADITVRLVESEQSPGLGWPYLSFSCHSNDLPLGVHYRVTIQHPLVSETPPSTPGRCRLCSVDCSGLINHAAPEPPALSTGTVRWC